MHVDADIEFASCSQSTMLDVVQRLVLSVGETALQYDGNGTFVIEGFHSISVPLMPFRESNLGAINAVSCVVNGRPTRYIWLEIA